MRNAEPTEDVQLRNYVEHLVRCGMPQEIVEALEQAPNGARVLRGGFGGAYDEPDKRSTFASFCLKHNRVDVWRAVVLANVAHWQPMGAMSSSVARSVCKRGMHISGTETTPHEAAVQAANTEGLRFAIEIDSSSLGLSQTIGAGHDALLTTAWRSVITPNLYRPVASLSSELLKEDVERSIECCRILLQYQAPWCTMRSGKEHSQSETLLLLCTQPWPAGHEEQVAALFKDFVEAGWFDPSALMKLGAESDWDGLRPLHAAAAFLHKSAAVALLELGADDAETFPSGHRYHDDLVGYARSIEKGSGEFSTLIARTLMERRIAKLQGLIEQNVQGTAPQDKRAA
jgi:hypothetical protein